jgi:hypothetical protein
VTPSYLLPAAFPCPQEQMAKQVADQFASLHTSLAVLLRCALRRSRLAGSSARRSLIARCTWPHDLASHRHPLLRRRSEESATAAKVAAARVAAARGALGVAVPVLDC